MLMFGALLDQGGLCVEVGEGTKVWSVGVAIEFTVV